MIQEPSRGAGSASIFTPAPSTALCNPRSQPQAAMTAHASPSKEPIPRTALAAVSYQAGEPTKLEVVPVVQESELAYGGSPEGRTSWC